MIAFQTGTERTPCGCHVVRDDTPVHGIVFCELHAIGFTLVQQNMDKIASPHIAGCGLLEGEVVCTCGA
jgi:hypothetical protein